MTLASPIARSTSGSTPGWVYDPGPLVLEVRKGAAWDVGGRGGECGGEAVFVNSADETTSVFGDDVFVLRERVRWG